VKQTFTITVTVQCAGKGTWSESSTHTVSATTLGRAEAAAKRRALAGRKIPFYAVAWLKRQWS
jgi:hypothetical protein